MERCQDIFRNKGYQLNVYSKDNYSFYHCLNMAVLDNKQDITTEKAMQKQNDLFEFEMKSPIYYHLFNPQCVECDGNLPPIDCLSADLKIIQNGKKPPTPREIFAAAEMLQRCICIIRFDHVAGEDIERLKGYMFAPTNKQLFDMEPICILMMERYGGCIIFSRICRVDNMADLKSCPGNIANLNHRHCFGLRFVNEFSVLFDCHVAFGERTDVKDLYRRLSLEFYGTERHHERILNIICNLELEEDNLELFCKYADNTITEETSINAKRRILKTHIEAVQKRLKPPGEGELLALSSVFNVDLIVYNTGRGEWETYMSVVCCYLSSFDSPIILRIESTNGDYMPYVTESGTCACRQQKPQIQGHIGKVKANIHDTVLKKPCCASSRHHNHEHLKHIQNIRNFWPNRNDYLNPTELMSIIITRLENEDRRLDQINGGSGSLANALAKELYGDEDQFFAEDLLEVLEEEELQLDIQLGRLSNRLKVPIYVYYDMATYDQLGVSHHFAWTKYEPDLTLSITHSDCRFYITLFYNRLNDTFDRIIPIQGCNCQIPPPLSLLRNSQNMETELLTCVQRNDRHHPLTGFLTVKPDRIKFEVELRDFPVCSVFSPLRIAAQRDDMMQRTFDSVETKQHSLFRCLSKEIFGTENNFDILIEELCNELLNNFEIYIPFIGENINKAYQEHFGNDNGGKKDYKNMAKFVKERIEDDLPCDELLLWLACTFFRTTIYVLRVSDTKTSTESFWTEYIKVRSRNTDLTKMPYFKKCPQTNTYIITLLETESKHYYRIVPKQASCNCVLDIPAVPDYNTDPTLYHTQLDCKVMRRIRKIDSLLNIACALIEQWLICNRNLQRHCELIISEIEGRRKNVNIATITGTSAGIIGAVLTGVGFLLAPVTAGISTILSVGGAVMAVSGGTVATGAKITESVLNNGTIDTLKRYQNCYKERFDGLKSVLSEINNELNKLMELSKELQEKQKFTSSDFAGVQSIPGIVRAVKGLIMIPLSVMKVSARGITILGAIIGPLSALIDTALLIFSAKNMAEGNKTDVTENLRRISAALYGSRRQMHSWAYGNQRQYLYD